MWQTPNCASQMTAAAVGAAATAAVTVTAVTAVTAAAAAASPTRYERTLRNCARDLSDFAGCTEPDAIWDVG
jgi:siroheme synthase